MLGFFSSRVDHPLADAKEATRILNELPGQEPAAAVDNATVWLESLIATTEFRPERRLERILRIDEAVLPQTRRLGREYLTNPRRTRESDFRLWRANHGYWRQLAAAYEDALTRYRADRKAAGAMRPQLGLLTARLLHALGGLLKWLQFRYGPIAGELWASAGGACLEAERNGIATVPVRLYANAEETTPAAEYLKVLLLHASSMDNLLPIEIEIAERIIAYLLPSFSLSDRAGAECVYWADATRPLPPTRLARMPEITPSLRFFATAPALDALGRLRAAIEAQGALPAEINFGGRYSPKVVLPVLDHLAACWSPTPPQRSHERRRVKSRMTVVGGLEAARRHLVGQAAEGDGAESWVVEDVSQGGIGAQVSLVGKEWLKVGSLVGMQPEGGSNWLIGMVRRVSRESETLAGVGIEMVSKAPTGVLADSRGLHAEAILLDAPQAGHEIRLALPLAAWEEQLPLTVAIEGQSLRLTPLELIETGAGCVLARYRAETA